MPPLRGPIDYNRYPPRRRPAHRHHDADETHAALEDDAHADAASTRGELDGAAANPSEFQESESSAPRRAAASSGRNRKRVRRREKLLKYEAAQRGQDGARVMSRRAAQAARKRKLYFRRARLVLCLLLLALAGRGVYFALTDARFAIAQVDWDGVNITPRAELEKVQNDLVGRNWLRAPLKQARAELSQIPTVRAVHLTRELTWPPRVLATLEERQPFARVGGGETWFVVDESGVPFRRATEKDDSLRAIVSPLFVPQPGVAFAERNWKAARELTTLLNAENASSWKLRRVYFDRHGFAAVRLEGGEQDGLLIQLGNDRWAEKLSRARRAVDYFAASRRRASTLNLVSYSMPIWTPRIAEKAQTASAAAADSGVS